MREVVCASGVELLMDFLEGVLPAELHAALEAHVAACPQCAAFVASYLATPRIVRQATEISLPADLEASLRAFLRERTSAFRSR